MSEREREGEGGRRRQPFPITVDNGDPCIATRVTWKFVQVLWCFIEIPEISFSRFEYRYPWTSLLIGQRC